VKLAYSRRKSTERASRLCPSVNGLSLSLLWDLWNDAPHLDGLAELYATPARELELIEIFKESSRLETDFWEMAYVWVSALMNSTSHSSRRAWDDAKRLGVQLRLV